MAYKSMTRRWKRNAIWSTFGPHAAAPKVRQVLLWSCASSSKRFVHFRLILRAEPFSSKCLRILCRERRKPRLPRKPTVSESLLCPPGGN